MKALVVANWKMNPSTYRAAKKLLEVTKEAADNARSVTIVVAPPALYVRELRSLSKSKRISFALQNVHFEAGGAHTGEISCAQASDARISYVIIGHAERRGMGETNDDTRKRVAAALSVDIVPILCVGETTRGADGEYFNIVKEQLRTGLADISPAALSRIFIAYEPVWAIGKESSMSPRDMHEMAIFIRKTIVELHGEKGMSVKILYGGAATESNAAEMVRDGEVNGLLVGHVSVDPVRFPLLIRALHNT